MRILVVSQVFYPDNVAVAQHLSDLCFAMVTRGHEITVITSCYPYEEKKIKYPPNEVVREVKIKRIWSTRLGKKNVFTRLSDFLSFILSTFFNLIFIKRKSYNLILGLTAPPLLSYICVHVARWKSIRFCYWIMDMQPELAIHSGMIRKNSILAWFLVKMGKYILTKSDKIMVLDRFMHDFLTLRHEIQGSKISVVPLWPVVEDQYRGSRAENPFRIENGFGDRIVIMYSGNHSYVHPLDTLLDLAFELRENKRFLFVFIGGGVRKEDVTKYKLKYCLDNIVQLPYQPREKIHISLGSSDIQVVILGDGLVGFTHPNKIYGALFIGKPIIYIGPECSHISEILSEIGGNIMVNHGETKLLREKLLTFCDSFQEIKDTGSRNKQYAHEKFMPEYLIREMCITIEEIFNLK